MKNSKKLPFIAPVAIVKFDCDGNVVYSETIQPEFVRNYSNNWEPETVRNTMRVMAIQETGEELFLCYANRQTVENIIEQYSANHPEFRDIFTTSI